MVRFGWLLWNEGRVCFKSRVGKFEIEKGGVISEKREEEKHRTVLENTPIHKYTQDQTHPYTSTLTVNYKHRWEPLWEVVTVLDCNTVLSEFNLQSGHYDHIQTSLLKKRYKAPYPQSKHEWNSTTTVLRLGLFCYWISRGDYYVIKQRNLAKPTHSDQKSRVHEIKTKLILTCQ